MIEDKALLTDKITSFRESAYAPWTVVLAASHMRTETLNPQTTRRIRKVGSKGHPVNIYTNLPLYDPCNLLDMDTTPWPGE